MTLSRRIVLPGLLAALSLTAQAQSVCRIYEYAELRDMRRDRLEQLYCDYRSDMYAMLDVAVLNAKAGRMGASQSAQTAMNRCAQELERVERTLDSKFSVKPPQCTK